MNQFLIKLFGFAIFLFSSYLMGTGLKNIYIYNSLRKDVNLLAYQVEKAIELQKNLKNESIWISQPEYWEHLARKNLNLIKKNEIVYKIIL